MANLPLQGELEMCFENGNVCLLDIESTPGETIIDYDLGGVTKCNVL